MRVNPYAERGMIRHAERFFGRTRELEEIFSRIAAMVSVSVVGERRIGKSSLLYHISQTGAARLEAPFVFHYLDLQRVLSAEEFYQRACELLRASGDTHLDFERALEGKRVILCLDEFEQVTSNAAFDADFFNVLRSLMQTETLALIVATQRTLAELFQSSATLTSSFYNIFMFLRLGPLTETEARKLIEQPAERTGQRFEKPDVDFLLNLAGTHPFRLNVAAALLYEAKLGGQVDFTAVRRRFEEEMQEGRAVQALVQTRPAESNWTRTIWAGILALAALLTTWFSAQMSNPLGLVLSIGLGLMALWLFITDSLPTLKSRRGAR